MQLKIREVLRTWKKLEMSSRSTGKDHVAQLWVEGRLAVRTKCSKGQGDVPGPVIHAMRRQFHLKQEDFQALVDCPMGREEYIAKLREKGIIA